MQNPLPKDPVTQEWNYYNHCMVPNVFPHEVVDDTIVKSGAIWKGNKALLARWTSDFDCTEPTSWWFFIKRDSFDLNQLKSNRRYKITKGIKYFDVRRIDPKDFIPQLYQVYQDAMTGYPPESRVEIPFSEYEKTMCALSEASDTQRLYGAFSRETDELCGYIHIPVYQEWAALSSLITNPQYEKYQINAALIYYVLEDLKDRMDGNFYISDGERNVLHKTNFHDYLEKYFLFRRAYCHLHIQYRPIIKPFVYLMYPFRKLLKKADHISLIHKVNGVLFMEEIRRQHH